MGHVQKRTTDEGQVRWKARYRGPDRKERSKTFPRKVDAQQWLAGGHQGRDIALLLSSARQTGRRVPRQHRAGSARPGARTRVARPSNRPGIARSEPPVAGP